MKVLILRADKGGCAFYRTEEPARVVQEQFPDMDIRVDTGADVEASQDTRTKLITVHEVKEDIDLLIVQRPLRQNLGALLEQARKQGIATIVELDDDFAAIHPDNLAHREVQPEVRRLENKEWLAKAAAGADLLTCTTPAIGKYNDSHEILPNYVPESIFNLPVEHSWATPTVGWTGTLQTHPTDLQVTNGQVGKVVSDASAPFFVVGERRGVAEALKLRGNTSISDTGWIPLEIYYATMGANIDLGIVPLERSDFNNAKSCLKGLEFAALGIPFVASATYDYLRLAEAGVGKIAHDHNGFRYALRGWLNNPESAAADGAAYRDIVRDQFTYEKHAADWVKAWERAIDIRKKASN